MENWDEVKTAYQVARIGTVSGAAEVLGVHHATVIRHIDALEGRLGVKLFQRHARGYTPTEAGADLLRVAQATDDQFNQLSGRMRGQGDECQRRAGGHVAVVAGAADGADAGCVPGATSRADRALPDRRASVPSGIWRGACGDPCRDRTRSARQRGAALCQPADGAVCQPRLCRAKRPAGRSGRLCRPPVCRQTMTKPVVRRSAAGCARMCPPTRSLSARPTPAASKKRWSPALVSALSPCWEAARDPELVEVMPPRDEWSAPLWLVTHVDLHRTTKVQTFLRFLKDRAKDWVAVEPAGTGASGDAAVFGAGRGVVLAGVDGGQ